MKPLVTEEEFKVTEEIVAKFGAQHGLGQTLQTHLENKANNSENWVRIFIKVVSVHILVL